MAGGPGIHLTSWVDLSDMKATVREVGVVHLAHHLELASTSEAVCPGYVKTARKARTAVSTRVVEDL